MINVAHHAFNRGQARIGLGRGLLGCGGFVAGVNRVLVGFIGLVGGHLNALGGAAVHVFNHLAVGRRELIELVHAVLDRRELPLDVLLAGKRIDFTPEALASFVLQRRLATGVVAAGVAAGCGGRLIGGRWSGGLLGERRDGK